MEPTILDHLPDGLLDRPASRLHEVLDGPTLLHLPGRRPRPLFVSVLQHGNEISGWEAVRRLLKGRYARDPLPRSLILLIANVRAASRNRRYLSDQPDYNRCWPGSDTEAGDVHRLFERITGHVRAQKPLASIDIHNNTGENPHYAAINRTDPAHLRLASLFSRTVLYFTQPRGVQSMAFGEFCPAVTLECGPPSRLDGADHALSYLSSIINAEELDPRPPAPEDIELFQMVATVNLPPAHSFSFSPDGSDIVLREDLDQLNFRELPPGTRLGHVNAPVDPALLVRGHEEVDASALWFSVIKGDILTSRPMMPAMLTTDERVIRQDCLCHLMERIPAGRPSAEPEDWHQLPESRP
ncbi:M14 family metallopeptidase [Wenzhouxiangella sediminis]|uniref:Peptidase M14 n=1 Tax=Wenzhouxiangella sediminis TaxID=1792836 RepID=A0A3E1KBJ5_9GAMM|nr:M14 family metallopeptidase [Wenzhouxiangella sediminis]RFF31990.1 peptidase M14 [Wenzhouxiangella sediminis]